jgi:hypothetical protein
MTSLNTVDADPCVAARPRKLKAMLHIYRSICTVKEMSNRDKSMAHRHPNGTPPLIGGLFKIQTGQIYGINLEYSPQGADFSISQSDS